MPASIIDSLHRFSPELRRHLNRRAGGILSPALSAAQNNEVLQFHWQQLFGEQPAKGLQSWPYLETVYHALNDFGRLPTDFAGAEELAGRYPSVMVFNKSEYVLTWEFLHFMGRFRFFQEGPWLLSYLYSLRKRELLAWASWLNPTLNRYERLRLIEHIYVYCQNFHPEQKDDLPDQAEFNRLFDPAPGSDSDQPSLPPWEYSLYRHLQRLEGRRSSARLFKYGHLVCRHHLAERKAQPSENGFTVHKSREFAAE